MQEDPVISVQGVSKAYRIWESPAARLTAPLLDGTAKIFPGAPGQWLKNKATLSYRDFWALKDISFDVKKGESIGIIGRNGSGKSTLLQIIAGTLQPTEGVVKVKGRVAALLELGSGFNPEFTGRENVYLNGAVLGLSRRDVDERFDRITAFADIGDFIEQPVKTYSSGMLLRLAFAVQVQLEPMIMIVDEALSVGDEPFQRKCFAQIQQMKEQGVTILFVSHSAATVVDLCDRAILLDRGEVLLIAPPKSTVLSYHELCYAPKARHEEIRQDIVRSTERSAEETTPVAITDKREHASSSPAYFLESMQASSRSEFPAQGAHIESIQILDANLLPVNMLVKGSSYVLRWRVRFEQTCHRVRFGWTVKVVTGAVVSGAATHPENDGFAVFDAGISVTVDFNFVCRFNAGTYFIDAAVRALLADTDMLVHGINDALMFKVQPTPRIHRNGYVDTCGEPAWTVTPIVKNPS